MSEPEQLAVSRAELGGLHVVAPEGSITHRNAALLKAALEVAIAGHEPAVALNLQAVSFLDSAALQVIVDVNRGVQTRGGRLKLVHPNEVCRDILRATRLMFEIEVCRDLNEAVKRGVG